MNIQDLTAKDIDVAAHSMEKGRDMSGEFEKKLVLKFGDSREFQEWCALFAAKCCSHVHPGYYDHEAAQKIQRLFGAVHPIFGTADYHGKYTPKQLLDMGKAFAEAAESAADVRRKKS